jgi:hypothetical protein
MRADIITLFKTIILLVDALCPWLLLSSCYHSTRSFQINGLDDCEYRIVIEDFVRKEKKLLRDNDLFAIIPSNDDSLKEVIIIGEDNKICLQLEPKESSVTFLIDSENDTVFYVDTVTTQNVIVITNWSSSHPDIWVDTSKIVNDYSAFPTRVLEYYGKLFYWIDESASLSKQTINTLHAFNQVDTLVPPVLPIRPDVVINDRKPYVKYVFNRKDLTHFHKYRVNIK